MLICLRSVYGSFHARRAALSSCRKDHLALKAQIIYYLAFNGESFSPLLSAQYKMVVTLSQGHAAADEEFYTTQGMSLARTKVLCT